MFKKQNKYAAERAFEKQSYIRLRGKLWYQLLVFLLTTIVGMVFAVIIGTFINVLWYLVRCVGNFLFASFNVHFEPGWSTEYLKTLIVQSLSLQTLGDNNVWVTLIMLAIVLFFAYKGGARWWDWTQLYSDRTHNLNRFATLKEIDATYRLVPDRNAMYRGNAGLPIAHISGYSLVFASVHPIKWMWQIIKFPLGLNREIFPKWYQYLRSHFVEWFPKVFEFQLAVEGGFNGFYFIDDKPTHEEILGATRAGKDQRYGYPSIDIMRRAEFQPNIVDTDAKNEDAKMSYESLRKAGYEVHLVNIQDVDWSESWNPLETALSYARDGEWDKARDEAEVVVQIMGDAGKSSDSNAKDAFWDSAAESTQLAVVLILIWLGIEHNDDSLVTPAGIVQFVSSMNSFSDPENENMDGLTQYLKMLEKLDPKPQIINDAINAAGQYLGSTGNTRTSIMFTFQNRSKLFASETIARLTSQSTIHVSDYGFPRLAKFRFDVDHYAGATVLVQLIDNDQNDRVLDEDSIKISRSGVVKCPFKINFPTNWEIRLTFKHKSNPKHLRDGRLSVYGERRFKHSLNGTIKLDKYSKKPEVEIVPIKKIENLFAGSQSDYELRYSEKPAAVFLITPQNNDNYVALASLFLGQVFSINTAISSEITRRKMDRITFYKLNEFSILPRIPAFDSFLTRGLTYGHVVNAYVQDHTQYEKHYSAQEAKEIKNQMLLSVYILSVDQETNKDLSDYLGDIEIQKENANWQSGMERQNKGNIQAVTEKVPLMSPKEISELLDSEMIIKRTIKRNDKRFNKVRPLPIFDTGVTSMPNTYDLIGKSYHLDYYTTDLYLTNKNKHLAYNDLFKDFTPYFLELQEQVFGSSSTVDATDLIVNDESWTPETYTNEQSETQKTHLTDVEVEDERAFINWQKDYASDLNQPFVDPDALADSKVDAVFEEIVHDIMSKVNYLHKTDTQTNAYKLLARAEYFRYYPEMNTRGIMLKLVNNKWDSVWEIQKRVDKFFREYAGDSDQNVEGDDGDTDIYYD